MTRVAEADPHKWAVGTTFEWEFEFPITTNPAYEPEPASTRKTAKTANPKPTPTHARKASKAAPVQTTKPEASEKPKRVRLTPEQRRNRLAREPLRTAASSKSRAYAETASNLPCQDEPVAPLALRIIASHVDLANRNATTATT